MNRKLLQINSVVNYRSTGKIVENIGCTAISQDWESFIAYGREARPSKSEIMRIGSKRDVYLHGMETRLFDRHGLGSSRATEKLINRIQKIDPDIIHLHNIHDYYINIEILFNFLRLVDIPVVWTFHDCWPITGHCAHFEQIGCEKWKTGCHHCPQKGGYPASLFADRSRKNYRLKKELFTSVKNMTIIPVSEWLGSVIKNSFLSDFQIKVINNGIDINIFHPQHNSYEVKKKYNIGDKTMLLGVSTAWSESKGLKDYHLLCEQLGEDTVIVLVGLTEKQVRILPTEIIGIKRTENINELVQLYSTADVVLNLSYQESFGLTTVEGFACGTPGIVYKCTASPELITEDTGFIVEPGDLDGVMGAINNIKKRGKAHFSKACRNRAVKFYDQRKKYQEYIDLYNILIQDKKCKHL